MSDLWDFGTDEQELSSASSDGVQGVSDTDFLLPGKKRRRVQQKNGKAPSWTVCKAKQEPEAGDSDIDLLNSPESDGVNLAASGQSQSHLQATRRPALDSRTSVLLHQLNATKNALQQAAARIDVVDDDDGLPDGSPVHRRYVGRQRKGHNSKGASIEIDNEDGLQVLDQSTEIHPDEMTHENTADVMHDKIILKLQSEQGVKVLKMRRTDAFRKMFEVYKKFAHQQGWIASMEAHVKFIFDGEVLSPDGTPANEDLEGDEMIEVRFPH